MLTDNFEVIATSYNVLLFQTVSFKCNSGNSNTQFAVLAYDASRVAAMMKAVVSNFQDGARRAASSTHMLLFFFLSLIVVT